MRQQRFVLLFSFGFGPPRRAATRFVECGIVLGRWYHFQNGIWTAPVGRGAQTIVM